jgi:hypothetical protein
MPAPSKLLDILGVVFHYLSIGPRLVGSSIEIVGLWISSARCRCSPIRPSRHQLGSFSKATDS